MRKFLILLILLKFRLKRWQCFKFTNQKSAVNKYYFNENKLMRIGYVDNNRTRFYHPSNVSLTWMLFSPKCKIIKII